MNGRMIKRRAAADNVRERERENECVSNAKKHVV
jgi:hypothetical protein